MNSLCRMERVWILCFHKKLSVNVKWATLVVLLTLGGQSSQAATIVVPSGGDLQAAINTAQYGDRIVLQAGGVYFAPYDFTAFTLPNKGAGSGYITITSSAAPPADGTRVTPADRANMPKLVARVGSPGFFNVANQAHHYRLSGLWFTNVKNGGGGGTTFLVGGGNDIGGGSVPHGGDVTQFAHDVIIDHCFFNPVDWDDANQQNLYSSVNYAVELAGSNITVRDSYMAGFGCRYASDQTTILDSGGVLIGTSPGPYAVDNNFIEAWFVGFFTGGGDPGTANFATVQGSPAPTTTSATLSSVGNLQVGDYVSFGVPVSDPANPANDAWGCGIIQSINGNSITFSPIQVTGLNNNKQNGPAPKVGGEARWRGWIPSNITITHNYFNKPDRWHNLNGTDGKGFFEIKLCDTCLIDGNVFNGQTGFTVTVRNQGGAAAWSVIKNLTVSNNLAVRFAAGMATLFSDNQRLSMPSSNIVFTNNLMYGDAGPDPIYNIRPKLFSGTYGDAVQFTHNTVMQSGRIMVSGSGPDYAGIEQITNFTFRDNIVGWGTDTQTGYGCNDGDPSVCTPGYVWTKNAMIGAPTGPLYAAQSLASFPSGNWNPATIADVGFTDPASGNYRLLASSPYYRAASDGKDVGVDMDQLLAHLNGPIPIPTPTPTPSSTPTPSPTPTPTPTATPTPTPKRTPLTASIISPMTNATYSLGSSVTIQANASDTAGNVTNVSFNANSQAIGSATAAPYQVAWSNMSAGTYTVTATAQDDQGVTVTSAPITVKISKAVKSVRAVRTRTSTISSSIAVTQPSLAQDSGATSALTTLIADLDQSYRDFLDEKPMFPGAALIEKYLFAASYLARASESLSAQQVPTSAVSDRLKKIDSYLAFCEDLMVDGVISSTTLSSANRVNAMVNLSLCQPDISPVGSVGLNVVPNGTARITSVASNPFSTQTVTASGGGSFELADVAVTFGGEATQILSVSPTELTVVVPADLSGGIAEIIVSSREGFTLHGAANVAGLNPRLFGPIGDSSGGGVVLDTFSQRSGPFSATPAIWIGLDARTRLSIIATGLSSGLSNWDLSNDVWLSNGKLLENLSENVSVLATAADGRAFWLTVEYAGAQGQLPGIDQIDVVLPAELAGAGTIQLTVAAGGHVSNTMTFSMN